jgi:hypothetical protein
VPAALRPFNPSVAGRGFEFQSAVFGGVLRRIPGRRLSVAYFATLEEATALISHVCGRRLELD